jgi:hypothetical protein
MNRLAQTLHYLQKVFDLKTRLGAVGDRRSWAQIQTRPVLRCLFLGVFTRVSSYLDLAQQTRRRRWRRLCHLQGPAGDDLFGYVTARLDPEDLRQGLAGCVKTLKQNKALENCKINGLLWVSLDANEHFASRSRCCDGCGRRQVEETGPDGLKRKATEYYHRYVFAQINGPKINALLDVEPIRPGEEEGASALRLLGRLRRIYGPRFLDAMTADAWYAKGPFLRAVRQLGWFWVVVLKREDREVFQEARQLSQGQKPGADFADEERGRQVQLWEVKDLGFSKEYGQSVRVVRSEEQWTQTRQEGGRRQRQPRQSLWVWAAGAELDGYPAQMIYRAGHRRWGIENKAFNELTQGYHLEHCYHHQPASMLAQMLVLIWAFLLFSAFAQRHSKLIVLEKITAKALAQLLNLALEEDLPWEQWFQSG